MKTVKSILLISCVLLLSFSSAHSQNVVPGSELILDKLRLNKVMHGIEYETYGTIAGDPYIYKDFHEGEMTLKNGETYKLNLRFDIYANQVHFKNNDQIYGIIYPEKIASVVIDTIRLLYSSYVNSLAIKTSGDGSYFILKADGKCKLLIKKNIRIQDAEPPKVLQDAKPAKFIHLRDTYYLKLNENAAVLIRNKKDVLAVMGDKKETISKYLKSNKSGTNNIKDLVMIVDYYNSL